MRIAVWEFNPNLWPTLATVLVLPLFLSFGFWQRDRAEQKLILHHVFEDRQAASVLSLNTASALQNSVTTLHSRKVTMEGFFSRGKNILLDNQVQRGVAGYLVYTPFKLSTQDIWILVNRGWIPVGDYRDKPPEVMAQKGILQISGSVKLPPKTGILLAEHIVESLGGDIVRVQKLELANIEEILNLELLPYIVRMDSESDAGFVRNWKTLDSGVAKHLAYAFQWFAMALAILVIYFILNMKRAI